MENPPYIIRSYDTTTLRVILQTAADSQHWAFHHVQLTPTSWFVFAHLNKYHPVPRHEHTTIMLGTLTTKSIPKLLKDLTVPGHKRKKMIDEEGPNMLVPRCWFPFVDKVKHQAEYDTRTHRIEIDYIVRKLANEKLIYDLPALTLHWEYSQACARIASFTPSMTLRWAECLNQLMLEAMLEPERA